MASERRVVSQQLHRTLELNWQFVILIILTLLHPGRGTISQAMPRRKSIHRLSRLFPLSPFLPFPLSTRPPVSHFLQWFERFILWLSCTHSISLFFCTYGFVSHQWPSLLLFSSATDILLGRDFHYLRSGTIYQGMGFSRLLWLTRGPSLYWIFHPSPFFYHSRLKLDWWQVWEHVHTVVHVLLLAAIDLYLCSQPWQKWLGI